MITRNHINNFSAKLKKILDEEINLGNNIVETSDGLPHLSSIIVFLEKPFYQK
ncbi:MAG: hypothetical protein ACOH1O_06385 [Flavobacterium sp.]